MAETAQLRTRYLENSQLIGLEDHRAFRDAALGQHRVTENNQVEFGLTVRYQSPATVSTKGR